MGCQPLFSFNSVSLETIKVKLQPIVAQRAKTKTQTNPKIRIWNPSLWNAPNDFSFFHSPTHSCELSMPLLISLLLSPYKVLFVVAVNYWTSLHHFFAPAFNVDLAPFLISSPSSSTLSSHMALRLSYPLWLNSLTAKLTMADKFSSNRFLLVFLGNHQ